jgi:cytochrome bd ubiquinol oxidase subunit II
MKRKSWKNALIPIPPLEFLVAGAILSAVILYALLAGADFGGGIWDLFAFGPRAQEQRKIIAKAIAPVWEANHVWLILAIVLLFTAFPPAFAAMMTALHIPMSLVLIGIVLRGSSFVFRRYGSQKQKNFRRWSTIFGIASFLTPFFLGLNLGALSTGEIQMVEGVPSNGFFAAWTSPFALSCGVFAQFLFAFLAAVYLTVEAEIDPLLQNDFQQRALISGILLAPIAWMVFLLSKISAPVIYEDLTSWWGAWLLAVTSICAITTLWALWTRRFVFARLAAITQVALILLGWGFAQYPFLVVPQYTITNAVASAATLRFVLASLGLGSLVLFPSLWYLFRVFKFGQE